MTQKATPPISATIPPKKPKPVVMTQKAPPSTPTTLPLKKTQMSPPQLPMKPRSQPAELSRTTSPGFFLSAGAGEQIYRVSGSNTLNTGPGWPLDSYTSNGISNQPYFFLAGGYTFARPSDWLPYYSLGMEYAYASSTTVSGYIDQYSLPGFKNYNFQYDVQLMTIMATLKADIYRWKNIMPYLSVGLGAANYSATDYSEQAVSGVTPRVNPAFGSNSGTNFSSRIGAGIDYAMFKNVWLNLEVNYTNFGKITTGNGANYATKTGTNYSNESLNNSVYATSALLGVTYYPG